MVSVKEAIRVVAATLDYPMSPLKQRSIKSAIFGLFGPYRERHPLPQYVRALDAVSFSVRPGERVGIIGRNGSGKSTLLRAIAGIYPITSGTISVDGTIQGMFDIGLGFEPEATGRENILYRGLVMGLSPTEVREREEGIVRFADLGDFIDFPVRTYSSGMVVRLAFSISTYLQGDILLLDEMLAAGDASFIEKAAARMNSLVDSASVVLLVSHSMATIRRVCPRCIWLDKGKIIFDGDSESATRMYEEGSIASVSHLEEA